MTVRHYMNTGRYDLCSNRKHQMVYLDTDLGRIDRWEDFSKRLLPEARPYAEALRKYIIEHKIKLGGFWHQSEGTPLFSDGTISCFSFRAWGDIMAAIWSSEENKDYAYTDFAWYSDEEDK